MTVETVISCSAEPLSIKWGKSGSEKYSWIFEYPPMLYYIHMRKEGELSTVKAS